MLLKVRHLDKKNRRHGKNYKVITAGNNLHDDSLAPSRGASSNTINTLTSNNNLCQVTTRFSQQQSQYRSPVKIPLTPLTGAGSIGITNSDEFETNATATENCDNSNDSGLGFEERQQQKQQQQHQQHHHHHHHHHHQQHHQTLLNNSLSWSPGVGGEEDSKRRKMDIKLESEDANFPFSEVPISTNGMGVGDVKIATRNNGVTFPRVSNNNTAINKVVGVSTRSPRSAVGVYGKRPPSTVHQGPITLTSQLSNLTRDGNIQLQIVCQPEQQHRARYQTEGSRGAVKDRTGNGFPVVRLVGYDKPTTLQVFIGTDLGRVTPHMFYQACRVSGKNSTPCIETKIDGTIVIEVDMDPTKDMLVTCDCVGILKERNVDVEHRFPHAAGMLQGRSKKKSTRCRMVFRTTITLPDGSNETLQVCSQPIVCTQPPGIPEICKKSLTSCPCTGGMELFILGKNLLKDTRIVFQLDNQDLNCINCEQHWECSVIPDKEFLQQTHLVCVVPPYQRQDLRPDESITVKLFAVSSGKTSEPHTFVYTAATTPPMPSVGKVETNSPNEILSTTPTIPPPPPLPPPPPPLSSTSPPSPTPPSINATVPANVLISETADVTAATAVSPSFLSNLPQSNATTSPYRSPLQQTTDILKNNDTTSSSSVTNSSMILWPQPSASCHSNSTDVLIPQSQQNLVDNALIDPRSSPTSHQLMLSDVLKSEVLDDTCDTTIMSDNSLQSMATTTSSATTTSNPLHQLHIDDNVSSKAQTSTAAAVVNQDAVDLLSVVDLMHNQQHQMQIVAQEHHQNTMVGIHEQSVIDNVLSSHHINKDSASLLPNESVLSDSNVSGVVVDLRMKHHEFDRLNNSATTTATTCHQRSLSGQIKNESIESHLGHAVVGTAAGVAAAATDVPSAVIKSSQDTSQANFVDTSEQDNLSGNILASAVTNKLDALVNSTINTRIERIVAAPISNVVTNCNGTLTNLQTQPSSATTSVKTMLLETLMPVVDAVVDNTTICDESVNITGDNNVVKSETVVQQSSPASVSTSPSGSSTSSLSPANGLPMTAAASSPTSSAALGSPSASSLLSSQNQQQDNLAETIPIQPGTEPLLEAAANSQESTSLLLTSLASPPTTKLSPSGSLNTPTNSPQSCAELAATLSESTSLLLQSSSQQNLGLTQPPEMPQQLPETQMMSSTADEQPLMGCSTNINSNVIPISESDAAMNSPPVNMSVHNGYLQSAGGEASGQMSGLAQQEAAVIQERVEQVVAQAQQQVEQVVAQVQQQALQTVQQAQQQVVQQVVQHAQVVQQAVQREEAVRQAVQAVPEVQQAVQQATQEVVQQSEKQATQEVVQQVQAVQQAVQQVQAAQAVQQVVQQDINSMLNQPAGFVAEASSVLANGAAHEPSQQRLTNAAEQAITDVITNATQDIINNRSISTTTTHAIIATKNILNSVVTQSAQLMNTAMETILPKAPPNNNVSAVVEQVASQVVSQKQAQAVVQMPNVVQQHNHQYAAMPNNQINTGTAIPTVNGQVCVLRKADDSNSSMLPQELTSMSDHDLLSYINPSCFDQEAFLI